MSIELFNQNFGTIHSTEQSPDTDQDYKSEQYFKNDVTPTMFFVLFKPKNLICILKHPLKSPKSSKNLCILETMLCQQNQSKLKYFMCNYDKDLKYIFNMI